MGVRDPFGYANSQVKELESTALKSKAKKQSKEEVMAAAGKELQEVDRQIGLISSRYADLCGHLEGARADRAALLRVLEVSRLDSSLILTATKESIRQQNHQIAKLSRSQARLQLQSHRGYDTGPASTYHQTSSQH